MRTTIRRALLSVYDKTGLPELAQGLSDLDVELVSSASTAAAIEAAGLVVTRVETVTGMPEMLDERVKTLHPKIHGGLLADRSKPTHLADLETYGIEPFDLVVSNLYPFLERPGIDTIDIGGPAMVRAAAKNHAWLTVVTSPAQYDGLLEELRANDATVSEATRRELARDAFAHTAAYDAAIVEWLQEGETLPRHLIPALERSDDPLRYGENPHQQAARARRAGGTP
jgi:phosphoribosylaminoimidazolecarboxamide formyltransferase/IMP cyclohydrolase